MPIYDTTTSVWMPNDNLMYPEIIENAHWEELYHEEDYQAIFDQLLAEDLGLPTI